MAHAFFNVLGLEVPNLLPTYPGWARPAGRLIWATLIFVIGLAIAGYLTTRPKPRERPTWAQAIVGAMLVWVMLILGYGTIPHEWLQFSASYLNFGTDTFAFRRNAVIPFDMTRQAVGHVVVVLIYGFMLTTNVALFARWQKRPEAPEAPPAGAPSEATGGGWLRRRLRRTSAYGRPVTVNE